MGPISISLTGCQVMLRFVAVTETGVPARGMNCFLGDTDYYSPMGTGTHAPMVSRARQLRGVPEWQLQRLRPQMHIMTSFWETQQRESMDMAPTSLCPRRVFQQAHRLN